MAGTGYTYPVIEGKITTFPNFALNCARAFGACISLRDEDPNTPIPEAFEPSPYHKNAITGQELLLTELHKMVPEEITKHRDMQELLRKSKREERIIECHQASQRLNQMIAEVDDWEPPTSEHTQLKSFMLEQLRISDAPLYDYDIEPLPDPQTYHQQRITEAKEKLEYHRKAYAEEIERTDKRNQWLTQLRHSLEE